MCTIRLRASPFKITIIQIYAPTSDYDDEEIEEFYEELQKTIDEKPKKDIVIVLGDWNAKVGQDTYSNWKHVRGPYCNAETNERGLRLLEFAILSNTLGDHKASRRMTYQAPNGGNHQIDYILVQQRFRTSINTSRTRSFPGADIGSDHDLVLQSFRLHLKRIRKPQFTRIKFDLEKLKDPKIVEAFKADIGGKFAPLLIYDDNCDIDDLVSAYEKSTVETATNMLGKSRPKKRPWVTPEILELCDKRRKLKKNKLSVDGKEQNNK